MRLDTSLLDAAPVSLLKVGVVAMAVLDASFLFGHLSDHQNVADSLPATVPPAVVMLALDVRRRQRAGRGEVAPLRPGYAATGNGAGRVGGSRPAAWYAVRPDRPG